MFYRSVFVLLSFGHYIVCSSVYADYPFGVMFYRSLLVLYLLVIVQVMIYKTLHQRGNQRKPKDRQYNDQKIKGVIKIHQLKKKKQHNDLKITKG
jgi:membrane protein implicated in regulation of membrane protease activity